MASKNYKITIGSRGSDLALWQAKHIQKLLEEAGNSSEIKIIKTKGDQVQNLGFDKMEGKGFFTKELEEALLKKEIDLAVHSHKDLPTESPAGLTIAAVTEREDPSELLIIHKNSVDEKRKFSLKQNAVVGTSSSRRKSQLLSFRDDLSTKDLRGNVPTRIQKLRDLQYDAILIASAGVERLEIDLSEFHVEKISPKEFVPAPAQGVLALQIRSGDEKLSGLLKNINRKEVEEVIGVERKILNLFEGGCQLPLGVYCESTEDENEEPVYRTWVSKADAWNEIPKRFYFESKKTDGLAEKIVARINQSKPCPVFISRDKRKHDFFFNTLAANRYEVTGRALIEFKKIPIKKIPDTDWIFFTSKNAVKYFFDQIPGEPKGAKYGAVSKVTASVIRLYGKKAEFIGYSTDTRLTGKQFASIVGSKNVLFPQAKGSMRTIQQQFTNPAQVLDLPVYETIKKNEDPVPPSDVMVFTSPSNVEAYFEKNEINPNQKIVAMGDATANALRQKGVKHSSLPATFDDLGLVQAVFGIS